MLDQNLLEILACPICKGKLIYRREQKELICKGDRMAFPIRSGIPVMLESEARDVTPEEIEILG